MYTHFKQFLLPLKSIPLNFPGAAADFQTSYTSTANKNFFAHDSNFPPSATKSPLPCFHRSRTAERWFPQNGCFTLLRAQRRVFGCLEFCSRLYQTLSRNGGSCIFTRCCVLQSGRHSYFVFILSICSPLQHTICFLGDYHIVMISCPN